MQHEVLASIDELSFALGVGPPEHKDDMFSFAVECRYRRIRQFFPSFSLMTAGFVGLDSESSVEE